MYVYLNNIALLIDYTLTNTIFKWIANAKGGLVSGGELLNTVFNILFSCLEFIHRKITVDLNLRGQDWAEDKYL